MLVKCDKCGAKKILIGLGGIERKCDKCDGFGYIDVKEKDELKVGGSNGDNEDEKTKSTKSKSTKSRTKRQDAIEELIK